MVEYDYMKPYLARYSNNGLDMRAEAHVSNLFQMANMFSQGERMERFDIGPYLNEDALQSCTLTQLGYLLFYH